MKADTKQNAGDTPSKYTWEYELQWYYHNFNWYYFTFLFIVPTCALFLGKDVELRWNTLLMCAVFHYTAGSGISIGYHRLWTHKSFQACTALRYFLAIAGAAQAHRSILEWVTHHRAHHQYTDTDLDPYNARRGFLFTHIGWLVARNPKSWGKVDVSDLMKDPVVVWQSRYYRLLTILFVLILPTSVAHFGWDDWKGGLLYCTVYRTLITSHIVFLVNSLAHSSWAGTQPYSDKHTARNVSPFWALLSGGETNHNFHHTFPTDFRTGLHWSEFDISQWAIRVFEKLGLAWDLTTVSQSEIEQAILRQKKRELGIDLDGETKSVSSLPSMDWAYFIGQSDLGRRLICIDGVVHDVASFMSDHPGGPDQIQEFVGKDATDAFHSGQHPHSPHAETLLAGMRVAIIQRP
ncbi:hypothetical protein FQN49_006736 [Arthroderma sp. PD_2]|nr:hypothetical protein FQN49_006736 [Arthroderma sp. PD_2]